MQSLVGPPSKLHVAIIMDGNGRWATRRGLPRTAGHRAGMEALRRIVQAAPELGVTTLTLFAFSSYNWLRAPAEVAGLMRLLGDYLRAETQTLVESGARLTLIGRRDRLPWAQRESLARIETATANGRRMHIRLAVDYSGREAIEQAAAQWAGDPAAFRRHIAQAGPDEAEASEVDLMIRTGGDQRLSDFLLWECAFAELWFTERMWPDFDVGDLSLALADFRRRGRASALPEGRRPWEMAAGA
ncbi:MAG: polyprenyl diphosphate synthase [Caulobacteraceae bacterium]|nr:polyprenyl diphosphate synthase [Caulobacteraceae bacterium]